MDELSEHGLGAKETDPATLAAWAQASRLEGRDVYDVNGHMLGRVTRCFSEEGVLAKCDVTLSKNAKGILGVDRDTAAFPSTWIATVDDQGVRLRKAGEEVVRPEDPRPLGAEEDRGAKGLPRKIR